MAAGYDKGIDHALNEITKMLLEMDCVTVTPVKVNFFYRC